MLLNRSLPIAIAFCATLARVSSSQSCDLAIAALAVLHADSATTVLIDHTVIGIPLFAFDGYSRGWRGDSALARAAEPALQALNKTRVPLSDCFRSQRGWTVVPDSALVALFTASDDGWAAFRSRYKPLSQFALISQPLIAGDTATLFVAVASGQLAGRGVILRLIRDAGGKWIKDAEVQLWIS